MHVVGETQRIGHKFALCDGVRVGVFVQGQGRAVKRINGDIGHMNHAARVGKQVAKPGACDGLAKAREIHADRRKNPSRRIQHLIAVAARRNLTQRKEAALVRIAAQDSGPGRRIDQHDFDAFDRVIGDRVEQEVARIDQQFVVQQHAAALGCREQRIARRGRHHTVASAAWVHAGQGQGSGQEHAGVWASFGGGQVFDVAGQRAAHRDRDKIGVPRQVTAARRDAQAGVAARSAIDLVGRGVWIFEPKRASARACAIIKGGVG